jgi:outer membrane protein assembly factor BamB
MRPWVLAAATACALAGAAVPAAAAPIPDPAPTSLPQLTGAPATARAFPATIAPQSPFMAPNPNGNLHDDPWMTDAYRRRGPLGRDLEATSGAMPPALCGSLTFDSRGRIVSVCPSLVSPVTARVIDPVTLAVLATYEMPGGPNPSGPTAFQNFTGGGYFFLDRRDRIWSATKTSHLLVLAQSGGGTRLRKVADYDLTGVLRGDERVTSALPDFAGRIWFVSKKSGKVGVLNPRTRRIRVLRLGEEIENSFAIDRRGVYIASDRRMYRFGLRRGRPRVVWRATYRNSGIHKPGQVDAGTGTTPTIMQGGLVAITDNADPMNVVVYRTAARLRRGERRTVCEVPVFARGASATENSLITAGRSLFVENNHGYQDPFGPSSGAVTEPGFARVDVRRGARGCRLVWTNREVRASTVVPKLSTRTGLIYAYERAAAPAGEQPWFWVAIDARTGATRWRRYAGSGLSFNNNYAGVAIGADGSAYLGVIGGIVRLRDGG